MSTVGSSTPKTGQSYLARLIPAKLKGYTRLSTKEPDRFDSRSASLNSKPGFFSKLFEKLQKVNPTYQLEKTLYAGAYPRLGEPQPGKLTLEDVKNPLNSEALPKTLNYDKVPKHKREHAENQVENLIQELNEPSSRNIINQIQEVEFKSTSGHAIQGYHIPARDGMPTVILSKGSLGLKPFGGALEHKRLIEEGYGFLGYDYPGYCRTQGKPNEKNLSQSLEAASEYLLHQKNVPLIKQAAYGISLGSGVTIDVAAKRKFGAVILQAPMTSYPDLIKVHRDTQCKGLLRPIKPFLHRFAKSKYDNINKIGMVDSSVLFLHGAKDELMPITFSEKLAQKATAAPKVAFERIDGGKHQMKEKETGEATVRFLVKVFPKLH
jgi:dienelactone hydrolase